LKYTDVPFYGDVKQVISESTISMILSSGLTAFVMLAASDCSVSQIRCMSIDVNIVFNDPSMFGSEWSPPVEGVDAAT
jgi:hypothetical protein